MSGLDLNDWWKAMEAWGKKSKPTVPPEAYGLGDCNKCHFLKTIMSPIKGVRISGGFGKCTRPGGPCENPIVKVGIGGVKSTWRKKDG